MSWIAIFLIVYQLGNWERGSDSDQIFPCANCKSKGLIEPFIVTLVTFSCCALRYNPYKKSKAENSCCIPGCFPLWVLTIKIYNSALPQFSFASQNTWYPPGAYIIIYHLYIYAIAKGKREGVGPNYVYRIMSVTFTAYITNHPWSLCTSLLFHIYILVLHKSTKSSFHKFMGKSCERGTHLYTLYITLIFTLQDPEHLNMGEISRKSGRERLFKQAS